MYSKQKNFLSKIRLTHQVAVNNDFVKQKKKLNESIRCQKEQKSKKNEIRREIDWRSLIQRRDHNSKSDDMMTTELNSRCER